jgi:hypothetical protein
MYARFLDTQVYFYAQWHQLCPSTVRYAWMVVSYLLGAVYGGRASSSSSLSVTSPRSGPPLFNNFINLCFKVIFALSTTGTSIGPEVSSSTKYPRSRQEFRVSPSPLFSRTHHLHSSLPVNSFCALNVRRPPHSTSTPRS